MWALSGMRRGCWPKRRSAPSGFGLHLLDDGFQHRQLHRDVDILLLSSADLSDHLLPAGNLREALRAAERADVIAIPADEPEVADWVKARGWKGTVWRVRRRMDVPHVDGPVAAFCGIARPEQFFRGLEAAGLRLAARFAFQTITATTAGDLERVTSAAQKRRGDGAGDDGKGSRAFGRDDRIAADSDRSLAD